MLARDLELEVVGCDWDSKDADIGNEGVGFVDVVDAGGTPPYNGPGGGMPICWG